MTPLLRGSEEHTTARGHAPRIRNGGERWWIGERDDRAVAVGEGLAEGSVYAYAPDGTARDLGGLPFGKLLAQGLDGLADVGSDAECHRVGRVEVQ